MSFRVERCSHPHCRTVVADDLVTCPHSRPFCEACVWEEGCPECDAERWAAAAEAAVLATGGDTHAATRAAQRTRRTAPWVDDDGAEEAHDARTDRGADTDQAADQAADRYERRLG